MHVKEGAVALFGFEDGRLVPAQFGYPVAQDLGPDLVDAIYQQILQIVLHPLFPVTWRDMTGQDDEETPRLTALDVTGQIVSVEILKELDSETLITSLSRLAEVASISWSDLIAEYPSGPEGFHAGWAQFHDSVPPAIGPGPRLIVVADGIGPFVRPTLSVLATSGAEVRLMNLRQMSSGRLLLDVNVVGPRLYGHAPQLLVSVTATPEITTAAEQPAPFGESVPAKPAIPAPTKEGVGTLSEEDSKAPTTPPTPRVAPHLHEVFTYSIDEEPPAPWKPAAEESSVEDFPDEQPASKTAEHAEHTVHGGDSEDTETELADGLLNHEGNIAEAREHKATEENANDVVDESAVSTHDGADAPVDESHSEEAPEQAGVRRADDACTDDTQQANKQQTPEEEKPHWERPAHMSRHTTCRAREESGELNDGNATGAAMVSSVDRSGESPEVAQVRAKGLPVLGRDEAGLCTLAEVLGQDIPLVARSELGLPADLVLAANGAISGAGLTYPSLDTLLIVRDLGYIDAWGQVRIGDRLDPILAEALDGINREIVREYTQAPRGQCSAKH